MAIVSTSYFGDTHLLEVDADPKTTSVDCEKGCLVKFGSLEGGDDSWYKKLSTGDDTNLSCMVFDNPLTLTDAANISWDLQDGNIGTVVLAGNRTLDNITNLFDGSKAILYAKQDATGSRTLSYGSAFKFAGGTAPTLSTGANAIDILIFITDGTSIYLTEIKQNYS